MENICFSVAGLSFGLAVALLGVIYSRSNSVGTLVLAGVAELILLLITWVAFDMYRNRPADSHTFKSLLISFMLPNVSGGALKQILKSYRTEDAKTQQDKMLQTILKLQAATEFGEKYIFAGIQNREEFREKIPLASYADLEPYIDRMADGEENVLTVDKLSGLTTTSGTTGKNKRIPYVERYRNEIKSTMTALLKVSFLRSPKLRYGRVVILNCRPTVILSKGGYETAPLSYHFSKLQIPGMAVSPNESHELDNMDAAMYVHGLFGFAEHEVCEIKATMSTFAHGFWRFCEAHHQDICDDMAEGSLKRCPNLKPELRVKLEKYLTASPERAEEVRREFKKGSDGLLLRIWPDCLRADMITTGGFAAHTQILAESYMKGVHFSCLAHSASEGIIGGNYNTDPNVHDYTFARTNIFFELIEEGDIHDENPKTIFLDEAEVGKNYEVVLTSTMGLYRYRLGDVVKITGKFFTTPNYEFLYRIGQMLNVLSEKTPENLFYSALGKAAAELDISIRDFTTCEDHIVRDKITGLDLHQGKHYVLFIELIESKTIPTASLDTFDMKLKEEYDEYNNLRNKGSIDQMIVVQVQPNTFRDVRDLLTKETQNVLQFKMPRVLRHVDALQLLVDKRV